MDHARYRLRPSRVATIVQPDEVAGLLHDALRRSPGARSAFLEHSGLTPETRALAVEALAVIEELRERVDEARTYVVDAAKELRWLSNDDNEEEIEDILVDLGCVRALLTEEGSR